MAHLLGSRNCIESLSKDVLSMQECIENILTNIGQLEYASWKYPNATASSLDIKELVEDYSYCSSDEDSNRLSHIILFELVIDRFCLLLQSICEMFDSALAGTTGEADFRPKSRTVTTTMSVGLVTKLFWKKMSCVQISFDSMEKEVLEINHSLMKSENNLLDLKVENERLRKKRPKTASKEVKELDSNEVPEEKENCHKNSAGTQTYETALVQCENCSSMQNNLLKSGSEVIVICEAQGLPSSLSKQKKLLKSSQISFVDISRWSDEEERDLKKISKHLHSLNDKVSSLQKQLSDTQQKYTHENSILTSERDEIKREAENLQNNHDEQCEIMKENDLILHNEKESVIRLTEENGNLKERQRKILDDMEKYEKTSSALEHEMNSVKTQLAHLKECDDKLRQTQMELSATNAKLEETTQKLNESSIEYGKLKAENKVLLKHDQGLLTRQANLLERIEKMDDSYKELLSQMQEEEEELEKLTAENLKKDELIQQLTQQTKADTNQINNLKEQLSNNSNALINTANENAVEMKSYQNRLEHLEEDLKLVVCYPVIGGDYNEIEERYQACLRNPTNQMDSGEDVIQDMENQIKANTTRIGILDVQNSSMRNSLMKLEQANSAYTDDVISQRTSTSDDTIDSKWTPSKSFVNTNKTEAKVVPRPPLAPRTSSKSTRLWSGGGGSKKDKKESFDIGAKLANLERIKNASSSDWYGLDNKMDPKIAWHSTDKNSSK